MKVTWLDKQSLESDNVDPVIKECLLFEGSLTRYLESLGGMKLNVELEKESWESARDDETKTLGLFPSDKTFIRESWLRSAELRLVFARTVIPEHSIKLDDTDLTMIGSTPLGEILFSHDDIQRAQTRFAKIDNSSGLARYIHATTASGAIWGRQSLFKINNKSLLVSEYFHPDINRLV